MPERVDIWIRAREFTAGVFGRVRTGLNVVKNAVFSVQGALLALGGVAILRTIKGLTDDFGKQQDAVEGLRAALLSTGKDGEASLQLLIDRAAELQKITRAGDEATLEATATLAQLARELTAPELAQAQTAIIGLADTFFKGDLNAAAQQLGKSIGSTTNTLSRYGVQVDVSASQSRRLQQVLSQTGVFFENSQAKAGTFRGLVTQLSNAWGDLREEFGRFIATSPRVLAFLEDIKEGIEGLTAALATDDIQTIRTVFQNAGLVAGVALKIGILKGLEGTINLLGDFAAAISERLAKAVLPDAFVESQKRQRDAMERAIAEQLGLGAGEGFLEASIQTAIAELEAAASAFRAALPRARSAAGAPQDLQSVFQLGFPLPDLTTGGPGPGTGAPRLNVPALGPFALPDFTRSTSGTGITTTTGLEGLFGPDPLASLKQQFNEFALGSLTIGELTSAFAEFNEQLEIEQQILDEIATPQEIYNRRVEELAQLRREGVISNEAYQRAVEQADAALQNATESFNDFGFVVIDTLENVFRSIARGDGRGIFGGITSGIAGLVSLSNPLLGFGIGAASRLAGDVFFGDRREVPVRVTRFGDAARRDLQQRVEETTFHLTIEQGGVPIDELQYLVQRREARGARVTLPTRIVPT